ncbi:HD domain-containing protein [Emticicia sp. 17c]|uniref:HD domain-containing protein n=1 Tax=Emticicia sp. 17c TaxID=3127704 RepID=UPI00301DBEA2
MEEDTHTLIETLLQEFRPVIGRDYAKYRNHVYRVFLNCRLIDTTPQNEDKYAIAAVFHDIGIWTHHTFDYLPPSVEQARRYLSETGQEHLSEEIKQMINWHHKVSAYKGNYATTVETFRRADWIDVSLGLLTYKINKEAIKTYKRQFPTLGFHLFLVKATVKNFFRHPSNPLPMFRK